MGLFFFQKPKIRRFELTPRFYDERKEKMEERRARIREEIEAEKNGEQSRVIRKGFLTEQREGRKSEQSMDVIRYAFFAAIVVVAVYLIL